MTCKMEVNRIWMNSWIMGVPGVIARGKKIKNKSIVLLAF